MVAWEAEVRESSAPFHARSDLVLMMTDATSTSGLPCSRLHARGSSDPAPPHGIMSMGMGVGGRLRLTGWVVCVVRVGVSGSGVKA